METVLAFVALTQMQFLLLVCATFAAGIVRGFSGFALSAIIMASAAPFIPPVQLLPICFWMEFCASILMARGGWREADRRVVMGLVIGSAVGTPIGLFLTTSIPVATSQFVVLVLVIVLALILLAKIRIRFLATRPGLYLSGLTAGVVTGLSYMGGMVVAVYVLSQDTDARKIRGSLALFLFVSLATSILYLTYFEVMTQTAMKRAVVFAVPTFLGVFIGQKLFVPRLEPYYRPFCLSLLTALGLAGLVPLSLS
jgi:hypothetical protein